MKAYTKWSDLKAKMSPEAADKASSLTANMLAQMPLEHLRVEIRPRP